jgi:putative heme-binding domain-containing protein
MIVLDAESVVKVGLERIAAAKLQQEQMFYIHWLRSVPQKKWTLEQRRSFLTYLGPDRPALPTDAATKAAFESLGTKIVPGANFFDYLTNTLWEVNEQLSEDERAEVKDIVDFLALNISPQYATTANMPFVREWNSKDLGELLPLVPRDPTFEHGKWYFQICQCINCHRMGDIGGLYGPDLTMISRRFSRQQILESIIEPSKIIADQYGSVTVLTDDGHAYNGRIVDESEEKIVLQPNPTSRERIHIPRSDIESMTKSKVSPMPEHLLDILRPADILDLVDYVEAGGDPTKTAAGKKKDTIQR